MINLAHYLLPDFLKSIPEDLLKTFCLQEDGWEIIKIVDRDILYKKAWPEELIDRPGDIAKIVVLLKEKEDRLWANNQMINEQTLPFFISNAFDKSYDYYIAFMQENEIRFFLYVGRIDGCLLIIPKAKISKVMEKLQSISIEERWIKYELDE